MEIFRNERKFKESAFYKVMLEIIHKRDRNANLYKSRLGNFKDFATKIIREGYLITWEKGQNKIINDQFLDSPYFNFMAEVWDSKLSQEKGNIKNLFDLANKLIEDGYTVTKQ